MEARVLAAVASPRRQEILRLTWCEERSAGEIHRAMPDVTFGAISLQIRTLVEAGLLTARVQHRHRFYRAQPEALGALRESLERMWDQSLWRLKLAAELEQSRRGPRQSRVASRTSEVKQSRVEKSRVEKSHVQKRGKR